MDGRPLFPAGNKNHVHFVPADEVLGARKRLVTSLSWILRVAVRTIFPLVIAILLPLDGSTSACWNCCRGDKVWPVVCPFAPIFFLARFLPPSWMEMEFCRMEFRVHFFTVLFGDTIDSSTRERERCCLRWKFHIFFFRIAVWFIYDKEVDISSYILCVCACVV